MSINAGEKIIWVDLLNLSSLYKIYHHRNNIKKIIYFNCSKPFIVFINFFFKKIIKIPILQFNFINESEIRINEVSLFEHIQILITEYSNNFILSNKIKKKAKFYSNANNISYESYLEYIKGSTFLFFHRPLSMLSIAKYFRCEKESIFIFRSSPLNEFILNKNPNLKIYFNKYRNFLINSVIYRRDYHFDKYIHQSLLRQKITFFSDWIMGFLGELLLIFYKPKISNNNIGVELITAKFRHNSKNDLFWLRDSNIDPKSVIGFALRDYDDKSFDEIANTGIHLKATIKYLLKRPTRFFFLIKRLSIIKLGLKYYFSTFFDYMSLFFFTKENSLDTWLNFLEVKHKVRLNYFEAIYRSLRVKILWSMLDIDNDKLMKYQALDNIKGIYAGSHWSNYPIYTLWGQKCYHLSFAWSQHFIDLNFSKFGKSNSLIVGYLTDYMFKKKEYTKFNKNMNNFVITYFDNSIGKDIACSPDMQKSIYGMFLKLLKKYDNIILNLKPKKFQELTELTKQIPDIKNFIDKERLRLFVDLNQQIPPHDVGYYSDLAIGIGINTAAAECCFAGTVSFHADLTKFVNNEFANKALGKVVFRNIVDLEMAIEKQILGKGLEIKECKELHKYLDPFQDGKAYLRVGRALKQVHEELIQ